MTVLWFIVWFVANNFGDREPLRFDPVNAWAATWILAMALDLARSRAPGAGKYGRRGAVAEPPPTQA
jgi:hypothetical protein